jgi:transposase
VIVVSWSPGEVARRYLARVLVDAAVSAGKTDTFLGERYWRIARRRDKKNAIVVVGRSILVII